ncbi:MAG: mechanosensitive ion channel family protein [bacterium]
METKEIIQLATSWLLASGLRILITVILTLIALRLSKALSNKVFGVFIKKGIGEEARKRADTLGSLLRYVLLVAISLTAFVMILGELGLEIGPILAAAGVVGLALGFGSQHLVQDIISGFFILLDDEIRVGDYVTTAGKGGVVERVNLRMTVLRDFSGNVHYIRNGQIDIVTNMTKDYSRYVFEIGVAYREDVDEVAEVIKQVDEELRNDENYGPLILEPIEIMGLDQFADSALIIKARTKTKPIKQWKVAREFNRRLKKAFDERDIEIPFPHLTLYAGQNKKGQAAPIHVVTDPSSAVRRD